MRQGPKARPETEKARRRYRRAFMVELRRVELLTS